MKKAWIGFAIITSLFLLNACTREEQMPLYQGESSPASAEKKSEEKKPEEPGKKDEVKAEAQYVAYSKEAFDAAADKKRVLFFHAAWCPTCKAADAKFLSSAAVLPSNTVVFKVNYDTEIELKKKYGVTYQHTFVYVDVQGNEIVKWNGGDTAGIISHLK